MEVYSPKKHTQTSFSKNEVMAAPASRKEAPAYFYDAQPVKSRHETFSEWIDRKLYVPLKEFFEKDVEE